MIRARAHQRSGVDLSIVIVNYNVRYFLEQCLQSVRVAADGLRVEIFVVDNASHDDSLEMLGAFPEVRLIANGRNVGFAAANNQAIREARGRYVLLLNPDTLVPEDCLRACLAYADAHPNVGALGVPMYDGAGQFLPESKRGFPSPWVSFAKMSGLSKLAPRSSQLNGYYAGHLAQGETNTIDVLAGAFMWLRAEALARAGGGLDEDYFMYGEDIDLSYLIQRAGYDNVYFADASIIHYKGESTRKRSLGYVRTFYRAMDLFAGKHLRGPMSGAYRATLRSAIYLRAALAVSTNVLAALAVVILDAVAVGAVALAAKWAWARYYFDSPDWFQPEFDSINVPIYTATMLLGVALAGGYDKPYRFGAALRGVALGTVVTLITYALLPTGLRSSRAVVLLTGLGAGLLVPAIRYLWSLLRPTQVSMSLQRRNTGRRLVVVGSNDEVERVLALLARAGVAREFIGRLAPKFALGVGDDLGVVSDLAEVARAYRLDEVIFCTRDVPISTTLYWMRHFGTRVDCRTVADRAQAIVGSPSSGAPGELYTVGVRYEILLPRRRRQKRLLDWGVALSSLLLWPILALFVEQPFGLLRNAVSVLLGAVSWVGYADGTLDSVLPSLRPSVLSAAPPASLGPAAARLNQLYARLYRPAEDVHILRARWRQLGRRPTVIARLAPSRWPHWAAAADPTNAAYSDAHAA